MSSSKNKKKAAAADLAESEKNFKDDLAECLAPDAKIDQLKAAPAKKARAPRRVLSIQEIAARAEAATSLASELNALPVNGYKVVSSDNDLGYWRKFLKSIKPNLEGVFSLHRVQEGIAVMRVS